MTTLPAHRAALLPPCLPGVEVVSLVSARTFPRHAHDEFGLGVIRAGGHASWSGCGAVEAGPGDVIAVSPEEMHDGAPVGERRSWDIVYVDVPMVARLAGPEAARREIGFGACRSVDLASSTQTVMRAIAAGEAGEAEEALTDLLARVLSPGAGDDPAVSAPPSAATLRVRERIADRPDVPPGLDEVAALMGMGRTGALRRFRRETGATPHAYAMQHRLRLARRALASGEGAADVAAALGFADQAHLTRAFARQFGLPPVRWRAGRAKIVQDEGMRGGP
ncbi:AraC family transcriptional regulator [Tropicimonas sp. IMCC34011]|uniref:AraC family transcriptional regulator n=1 Tax=Tropicimonas sp. IMCC34011 TaxID=2248759 RepID=UPI000E22B181|nr:AraC family transcriptional regulator [Tropicimonas sp. IMCC34011]